MPTTHLNDGRDLQGCYQHRVRNRDRWLMITAFVAIIAFTDAVIVIAIAVVSRVSVRGLTVIVLHFMLKICSGTSPVL